MGHQTVRRAVKKLSSQNFDGPAHRILGISQEKSAQQNLKLWHRLAEGVSLDDLQYVKDTAYYRDLIELLPLINKGAAGFATEVDEQVASQLSGNEYVHTDLRADNILITPEGQAVLVDWPWANIGNADLDLGLIAVDALILDGQLTEQQVLELMPTHRGVLAQNSYTAARWL